MTDDNSYKDRSGQGFLSWRGFEKRSHAAEHVVGLPFFPKKNQQFRTNRTPQAPEKGFSSKTKKIRHARQFRIQGENALLV